VVLLDIFLPRMNGWDVAPQIKEDAADGKSLLIAVTGWAREEDQRHSAESGIDLHLVKPVDPDRLRMILANVALGNGLKREQAASTFGTTSPLDSLIQGISTRPRPRSAPATPAPPATLAGGASPHPFAWRLSARLKLPRHTGERSRTEIAP
jgi:CheY-like chemotaxis protein